MMKGFITGCLVGFLIASALAAGRLSGEHDEVERIKLQYAGCIMIGDKPTNADMLQEDSHE